MAKRKAVGIIFIILVLTGCAATKKWTSTPQVQTAGNNYFEAQFEPIKKTDYNFFVSFRLIVNNKTKGDLNIDWNKTRYLLNGRDHGVFVFKGIEPETISEGVIPPDTIAAGKTFSKEISPLKMVARAPLGAKAKGPEGGINPGILPEGENGINLVMLQNGREILQKITVHIESTEEKKWR